MFCIVFDIYVEYSTLARSGARAEVRARQNYFKIQKVHEIFYLLHIYDVLISFELVAVHGFEICDFFEKKLIF